MPQPPTSFATEDELDAFLTEPSDRLTEFLGGLDDDLVVLGAAGKMGISLCGLAARALQRAGSRRRVVAVSRFSDPAARDRLHAYQVETHACDLLDREAVGRLPRAGNVIFMAGRKFGTTGEEPLTWAVNTLAPAEAARHYAGSRIVAFSTGCVYPPVPISSSGCSEADPPAPVGEYSQSCLGRERVFEHFSRRDDTPVLLYRLNYAIDLRYGVLYDLASAIHEGRPVPRSVTRFNLIWQGDANERALLALGRCAAPAAVLNITGPETLDLEPTCQALGEHLGRPVTYTGTPDGVAYLNDASRSLEHFGPPRVTPEQMIAWVADWVRRGGAALGKPTHFEVTDGTF